MQDVLEANKNLVLKFIQAFSDGDVETSVECLSTDAVTYAKGFGVLSGPRPYEIIIATTAKFKDIIPTGLQPDFLTVIAQGDRVAVEFEGHATLSNGEEYNNEYCMVFTVKDGRITKVNEYYCTILADTKVLPLLSGVEEQRHALASE